MKDFGLSPSTRPIRPAALLLALVLAAALVATLSIACGSGGTKVEPVADPEPGAGNSPEAGVVHTPPADATQVAVTLKEWSVDTDRATVPAGTAYFLATNAGGEAHEFVVIRTDLAPGALPQKNGKVPEDDVDMLGEIEPFSPGSKASIALELEPGNYVLICNRTEVEKDGEVESHYLKGMHTAFTVQ